MVWLVLVKHNESLWFHVGPIVLRNTSNVSALHISPGSHSDKDLPADGILTAEGRSSSIVMLQVVAPSSPLHFLRSPRWWIYSFLPPPSGLLVTAEPLVSSSSAETSWGSICGEAHVPPISVINYCCFHPVSAPREKLSAWSGLHVSQIFFGVSGRWTVKMLWAVLSLLFCTEICPGVGLQQKRQGVAKMRGERSEHFCDALINVETGEEEARDRKKEEETSGVRRVMEEPWTEAMMMF